VKFKIGDLVKTNNRMLGIPKGTLGLVVGKIHGPGWSQVEVLLFSERNVNVTGKKIVRFLERRLIKIA